MRVGLPSGTVTLLFTDIEGSTRLLHQLGADRYAEALGQHRRVLRDAFTSQGGVEVDTQGDAFFVAFPTAADAATAALAAQEALAAGPIRVRMGMHTGTPTPTSEGYVGVDVHRGARVAALAHGGQVLVTESTAVLLDETLATLELGLHRLKDFDRPVLLFQLGQEAFPPLRTPGAIDLPTPTTRFIGRERQLYDAVATWIDRDPRILTILGPGGAGKTRFALELARLLADDADGGTTFIPLAPLTDASFVVEQVAERMGAASPDAAGIASRVGERRTHLVLDNLEQLLPAVARPLADLARSVPALRLIVTSREPLRIAGEAQLDLPPLDEQDATTLFLERAHDVRPDLVDSPAVHELVRRLDGLPLALELAAARAKLLEPAQLLDRLGDRLDLLRAGRDAEERHATLRATIAWSHDLLDDDERTLFARLGVFASGCSLSTAERVCDARLEVLESLVDKSLIRTRPDRDGLPRFWMLETIREFAGEELDRSGERDAMERSRLAWLLDLAAASGLAEPNGGFGGAWDLEPVAAEHDEIRSALAWGSEHAPTDALDLAASLAGFWVVRAPHEGGAWLERLLAQAPAADPALRARALLAQGGAIEIAGGFEAVGALYEQSRELFELAGDDRNALTLAFRVLVNRINVVSREWSTEGVVRPPDPDLAAAFTAELTSFQERFRANGDRVGECQTLTFLAQVSASLGGDLERAEELFEAAERSARAVGWGWWEAATLYHGAQVSRRCGDWRRAREKASAALQLAVGLGDRMMTVYAAGELAAEAAQRGDLERAGLLWGAIEAEEESAPIGQWPDERAGYAALAAPPPELRDAFDAARERGRLLTVAQAAGLEALGAAP